MGSVERLSGGLITSDDYERSLFELVDSSCGDDDSQVHRVAVGMAVPQIVELLRRGVPEVTCQAAAALGRLAEKDGDYKAKVAEADAIMPLVHLVAGGDEKEQEKAALALASLCNHCPQNRNAVAGSGAAVPLVALLRGNTSSRQRLAACEALLHLSRGSRGNKAIIALAGAIAPLVALLSASDAEVADLASLVLASLAANNYPGHASQIQREAEASNVLDKVDLKQVEATVTLHIYDVSGDARVQFVNDLVRPAGTGAFHAGVEVYGQEWSFGCREDFGTGVFNCDPRENPAHLYRESVSMDVTTLTKHQVADLVERLELQWRGRHYDLLTKNCCHFCDAFCRELEAGPAPGWIMNLAGTGQKMLTDIRSAVSGAQVAASETAQAVRDVAREMDQKFQISGTAEAVSRNILGRVVVRGERDIDEISVGPSPQCRLLETCGAPPEALGNGVRGLISAVSQLWQQQPALPAPQASIDAVLECIYSSSADAGAMPKQQRCIGKRISTGDPWAVGPSQQPQTFARLLPAAADAAAFPWECLFELAWEPPCLFLKKPVPEAPVLVNGVPVRQTTFVLLHNSEIGLLGPDGKTKITFRLLRDGAAIAKDKDKVAVTTSPVARPKALPKRSVTPGQRLGQTQAQHQPRPMGYNEVQDIGPVHAAGATGLSKGAPRPPLQSLLTAQG